MQDPVQCHSFQSLVCDWFWRLIRNMRNNLVGWSRSSIFRLSTVRRAHSPLTMARLSTSLGTWCYNIPSSLLASCYYRSRCRPVECRWSRCTSLNASGWMCSNWNTWIRCTEKSRMWRAYKRVWNESICWDIDWMIVNNAGTRSRTCGWCHGIASSSDLPQNKVQFPSEDSLLARISEKLSAVSL